mmetsp:Transcript_15821/g.41597  ORF Transcript_15821/g.41597 Transcript_15821/m.41597 type:complete len:227 (+) Transcript_15821:199-879(+)
MLESLSTELFLELTDMHEQKKRAAESSTSSGRLRTGFGWVLVVFCVVRVVIASYNVVVRRDAMAWRAAQPDVATTAIRGINVALAGSGSGYKINVGGWAQVVSFILIGILMVMSTRAFMVTVRSVWQSRRSSTGIGGMLSIHGGIMAPLTTQLMGMYLLSSLLLLRANVPCEYRHSVSVLLGEVEVGFYYQWFDTAFIVSAVAGAAVKIAGLAGVSDSGVDVNDLT